MDDVTRIALAVLSAVVLALSGCAAGPPESQSAQSLLAEHGLEGMGTQELVDHLDRMAVADRPGGLMASVRVDELLVSAGEEEAALALPEDAFYLSFAPYVAHTHECFYHSLTTCQGELSGEDLTVSIVDAASGEVLVDETATTFDNGFLAYWLPRDIDATITVTHDGLTGAAEISTGEDSPTCLTTLQLTEAA